MKKVLLSFCFILFTIQGLLAQKKGETTVGLNIGYGIEVPNTGMGLEIQYGVRDDIRLEAGFDYFFRNKSINMWDLNLNAHYLVPISKHFEAYPLVGFAYTNWGVKKGWSVEDKEVANKIEDSGILAEGEISGHSSKVGANLGAGFEYNYSSNLTFNIEAKYQLLSDLSQAVFSLGIAYRFELW